MGKIFMPTEPLVRSPRMFEAAAGRIKGVSGEVKFFSTIATTVHEDFWNVDGNLSYLAAAEALSIVSDDANDTDQGTGAWTVQVVGLDENWMIAYETVTLTGLTPVVTSTTFLRVYRLTVITGGAPTANIGTITATATPSATVQAAIDPIVGQSLMSHFTPPVTHCAFITAATMSVGKGKDVSVHVHVRDNNVADGVFKLKREFKIYQSTLRIEMPFPRLIPPKVDYKWHVQSDVATTPVAGDYDILLVDKDQVNLEEAQPFIYEAV